MKINRTQLTETDIESAIDAVSIRMRQHLKQHGAGVFISPHESVGCFYGQLQKLSKAADDSIYTDKTEEFEERCIKLALPAIFAIASLKKNRE